MNLAIASPSRAKYSETFVQMQMDDLPCTLKIHELSRETSPGGHASSYPGSFYLARRLVSAVLHKKEQRSNSKVTLQEAAWTRFLGRALNKQKIDMVLANFGPTAVNLMNVCKSASIPLVAHFHGYDAHNTTVLSRHADDYQQLGQYATAVIAVSHAMRASLIAAGIPSEKIELVRYGVDAARFKEKTFYPKSPLFVGVGRFVDKKAPYLTLLAFKKVHDKYPEARLVLAGDGHLFEVTKNLTHALGLIDAVEYPGVLNHDQVAEYMHAASAFVQHSIQPNYGPSAGDCEGTPVVILEAMVTGIPIISTKHTGIGEVIECGRTGWIVQERDADGMAAAMIELIENPENARARATAARAEALEKYTNKHYIDALSDILSRAVARSERRRSDSAIRSTPPNFLAEERTDGEPAPSTHR